MAEYKNGFNAFGGIPVDSSRRSSDLQTGRAVYVNEDEYSDEPDYKSRVDQTVNEGYHREAPFEAPEIVVPEPIIPSGTKNISENGVYDVAQFAKANVNVAGGGGSSDFSIANVTVVNNSSSLAVAFKNCPAILEANEMGEGSPAMLYYSLRVPAGATVVFRVPLYKGTCVWNKNPFGEMVTHSVSGNIDTSMDMYLITGDGTITLNALT